MAEPHTFAIQPIERFAGKSSPLKRPKEITCFSYDDKRKFSPDASSLQYYYPATLGADLSSGYHSFQKWDDSIDEHLDGLLRSIMELERETGQKCEADFITWRGMMTRIMSCPYEKFNGFSMNATLFQGTMYAMCRALDRRKMFLIELIRFIEEDHPFRYAEKEQQRSRPPPRRGAPDQDIMSYWGYKFETLSVIPDIWDNVSRDFIESRDQLVVNNAAQYCSVVRTGIGGTSLVLGGEVDCVWDRKPADPEQHTKWVELKTSEEIHSEQEMAKFERKLLKFWVQSFLLGVPRIIVGFRSKSGILQRLEEIQTQTIPGNVKRRGRTWDGNTCVNFAAAFLDYLKNTITGDGVWKIQRRERSSIIEVYKVEESGHGDFLLDEFVAWRQHLLAQEIAKMLQ